MTWSFTKNLPTLGMHYKSIPDQEYTLPECLLPGLSDPTRGIDTLIVVFHQKFPKDFVRGWCEQGAGAHSWDPALVYAGNL